MLLIVELAYEKMENMNKIGIGMSWVENLIRKIN